MSKLEFNITEIPEGESRCEVFLKADDLELESYNFKGATVAVKFNRARRFIETKCTIDAEVELVCDRCLEPFVEHIASSYDIVFKTGVEEETEDENGAVRRFDFSSNSFSIEQEVRDSIMLEIPMRTIHPKYRDEEGKLEEFETKSFGDTAEPDENKQSTDPRWKKLKELKDDN